MIPADSRRINEAFPDNTGSQTRKPVKDLSLSLSLWWSHRPVGGPHTVSVIPKEEETPTSAKLPDGHLHLSDEAPADTDGTPSVAFLFRATGSVQGGPTCDTLRKSSV